MIYCQCGCTWNPDYFDECPKCGDGTLTEPVTNCVWCGTPLTIVGMGYEQCERCYNMDLSDDGNG